MKRNPRHGLLTGVIAAAMLLQACTKAGCDGPALNMASLSALRSSGLSSTGPKAFLILPNPIDATNNPQASVASTAILSAGSSLTLPSLLNVSRLENAFLKTRIKDIGDSLSTLATPNSKGNYAFQPSDVHYSETMAYRSITAVQAYVEALGFPVVKSRPLYVMVQAAGSTATEVNAFYDHAYLNPATPRTIKVFGSSQYAPGMDQDIYWHEFGHMVNESVSAERGIDYAGDTGAVFSEAGAIHECLADYLAESVSGKPYIGKWIARNISGYAPGQPLRSAQEPDGKLQNFGHVAIADGTGNIPDRYGVGEWCTRVLWDVRKSFVADDSAAGPILSDRMVYSAVSLLTKDTSMTAFKSALIQADEQLHCGGHQDAINTAFESRGFVSPGSLSQPLTITASPIGVSTDSSGKMSPSNLVPGAQVVFSFSIQNPNSNIARNVRVKLESSDSRFHAMTYQQSFGDMEGGQKIAVGGSGGLSIDFSVVGQIDQTATRGRSLPYTLRVLTENGQESVFNGVIPL
jgi:hypothetical protein